MVDQPFILALDVGTSSARALLYDASGTAVPGVSAQQSYQLTTSQEGEASVDADSLVDLVVHTIDEVLQKAGARAAQIIAVATSTFWHTLLPLNASGHPLMSLLTWEDTRPQHAATALRARLDEAEIHRRTGVPLHASYWPAKISWLVDAHPEIVRQTARYVSFGEYLHTRLLGRAVCSLSMASGTGLLNMLVRAWDTRLLELLHISPSQLAPLGDLPNTLQGLKPEFAKRWPILKSVLWFPPLGDGAAANIGSNCADVSAWAVTIGTSSAMRVVMPSSVQILPEKGLWLYYVDARRAIVGGALSEGGNVLAWLKNTLQLPDPDKLETQMASLEPAAHGLTILPQLAGERSPGWHAHASLTISGLTLHSTPVEIARAALEAVACQLSQIYHQLAHMFSTQATPPRLIASGGALLSSPLLSQILADMLNRPIEFSRYNEASARGAALLALENLRLLPDLTQATPETSSIVYPNPDRHKIYQRACARQQVLYKQFFP